MFTDGSVHVQSGIGYGAFIFTSDLDLPIEELKKDVKIVRFEDTSSTQLELQILLAALSEIQDKKTKITVFSDSQNIIGLPGRRSRLEKNNFYSKTNRLLKNAELYKAFYEISDKISLEFVQVKGHKISKNKSKTDFIFTLVDRASRVALRKEIEHW